MSLLPDPRDDEFSLGVNRRGQRMFAEAHRDGDTDFEPKSIHHTLGPSAFQAAPGNHSHRLPVGQVQLYFGLILPENHVRLDGATLSKTDYPKFFDAVGVTDATLVLPNIGGMVTRVK